MPLSCDSESDVGIRRLNNLTWDTPWLHSKLSQPYWPERFPLVELTDMAVSFLPRLAWWVFLLFLFFVLSQTDTAVLFWPRLTHMGVFFWLRLADMASLAWAQTRLIWPFGFGPDWLVWLFGFGPDRYGCLWYWPRLIRLFDCCPDWYACLWFWPRLAEWLFEFGPDWVIWLVGFGPDWLNGCLVLA